MSEPKMRSSEEWASHFGSFSFEDRVSFVEQIQSEARALGRYGGMTEAAEIIDDYNTDLANHIKIGMDEYGSQCYVASRMNSKVNILSARDNPKEKK